MIEIDINANVNQKPIKTSCCCCRLYDCHIYWKYFIVCIVMCLFLFVTWILCYIFIMLRTSRMETIIIYYPKEFCSPCAVTVCCLTIDVLSYMTSPNSNNNDTVMCSSYDINLTNKNIGDKIIGYVDVDTRFCSDLNSQPDLVKFYLIALSCSFIILTIGWCTIKRIKKCGITNEK